MRISFFLLLVSLCWNLTAQKFATIENRWQKDGKNTYVIHVQEPTPDAGKVEAGWWSKDWTVEETGDGYVRFKNRWRGTYLDQRVDAGPVKLASAKPGDWSAQWKLEPASNGYYRIKNRWRGTYLHIQNKGLETGPIQPGWYSAQWKVKGYTQLKQDEPVTDSGAPATSWIYANRGLLGNTKLNRLVLPGTHDSGTHNLDNTWNRTPNDMFAPDTDDTKRGLSFLGEGYHKWAKAQERTIYQQLNDGIRYLDVRVCVDKSGTLKTCHGLYGVTLQEVIKDVKKFADENPKEPFIIDFKKFYDWNEKTRLGKENEATFQGIRQSKLDELATLLETNIGQRMASSSLSPESTLNELLAKNRPIIVLWDKPAFGNFQASYLWSRTNLAQIWQTGEIKRDKLAFYVDKINALQSTPKFIALECQITPSTELYKNAYDFTGSFPFGLEALAAQSNPVILAYLANEWKGVRHNIINVDFYNQTGLIALCKQLNGVPTPAPKGISKTDRSNSTWGSWKLGVGSVFTTSEHEYRVEIDACHGDLTGTGTANRVTVEFWDATGKVAGKYEDGPGDQCSIFLVDNSWSTKTTRTLTHIIVKTNGGDGYFIDQLKIFKGGELIKHHGRDDGGGWCLSTDASDAHGDWKDTVTTCRGEIRFGL